MWFADRELKIKGNSVRYYDEGPPDGQPIIFIHGFPFNKSMWNAQVQAFESTHRVLAYDVRGHDGSSAGTAELSLEQFGDDLIAFMEALSVTDAVICGLSMGGYIALNVLGRDQGRFRALVLCDTQCKADAPEAREKRIKTIASIRLSGLSKYADESVANLFAPITHSNKPEVVSFIKDTILRTNADTICKTLQALADRKETCGNLSQTKLPVLIMVGQEDKVTPPELAMQMHQLAPNSQLETISAAGHLSNLENPEAFNATLKAFLNKP
jgi:3-oxoadipate enol-lactonase